MKKIGWNGNGAPGRAFRRYGALLFFLSALLLFCGCSRGEAEEDASVSEQEKAAEEAPFVAPAPLAEGRNGVNNIYCAGLSCAADDLTYYVKEEEGSGCGTIRVLAADGSDTLLYTSKGNIEYLTATTDRLWFVVTLYNGHGHFDGDIFCSMDRATAEVTEHFTCEDRIIALSVTTEGIYLCTAAERSGSKVLLTDGAGREPQILWERADIISDCVFSGDSLYFISNNRLWQCHLDGGDLRELASSLYMLGAPMVVGETVYYVDYDSYLAPTLYACVPDGTTTPLVTYESAIRISALNYDGEKFYLVKSTVDVDGNTLHATVVDLDPSDGSETELFAADTEVYGLSISNRTIFFYDLAAGQALRHPLN